MTIKLEILKYRKENPLAYRVLFYVIFFSSCVTLTATAWQLYMNFKKDLKFIEQRVSQIDEGYGRSLSLGVWYLDIKQIHTLLGGIKELPDIQYLEIKDKKDNIVAFMGEAKEQGVLTREYPLEFLDSQGKSHLLGKFSIIASLSSIYSRLSESVFQILISQTIKTFLVSGFILLVIQHFITRHLSAIAQYMSLEKLGYLEKPIRLQRDTFSEKDELERVIYAINRMRHDLIQYISQRDETEEKLNNAKQYIDAIINSMPSVIAGVCSKGRVTQWNHGAEILTGFSRTQALGRPISSTFGKLDMPLTEMFSAIKEKNFFKKENVPVHREKLIVFYDINIYPLSFSGQDGAVIRMDDVTERVKLEEMMIHNEKMHSVGILAAGVAHEINNPTTGIINLSQIIMNDSPKKSEEYDIALRIEQEGERIASIVSSLLSFSSKAPQKKISVNIQEILEETFALTGMQLRNEGIKLSNEIAEDLPLVRVDPQQIQQVFLNIINNSQFALNNKFSGKHEEKVIQIQSNIIKTEAGLYLRTIFTDHGTGIPNALLHKTTDPFFTTKPPGVGTGLGLSISSNIIKNHKGVLKIESRENDYTKVVIDLPLSRKDIDELSLPEKGHGLCHGESHEI